MDLHYDFSACHRAVMHIGVEIVLPHVILLPNASSGMLLLSTAG